MKNLLLAILLLIVVSGVIVLFKSSTPNSKVVKPRPLHKGVSGALISQRIQQLSPAQQKLVTQQMYKSAVKEGFATNEFYARQMTFTTTLDSSSKPLSHTMKWPSRGGECQLTIVLSADFNKVINSSSQCR